MKEYSAIFLLKLIRLVRAASAVNLEVITQSIQTVNVTVRGERFALYRLTDSDIEAYASTINVNTRGVYNLQ